MQRCSFFWICLSLASLCWGQEHSYQFQLKLSSLQADVLPVEVQWCAPGSEGDSLRLSHGTAIRVSRVEWVQGRIKGDLPFRSSASGTSVVHPPNAQAYCLHIHYELQLVKLLALGHAKRDGDYLILNPLAIAGESTVAALETFVPKLASPKQGGFNLRLPKAYNASTNGKLSFQVVEDDYTAFYFDDDQNPEHFYLAIGRFDDRDPEEIIEEFDIVVDKRPIIARAIRDELRAFSSLVDKSPDDFSDAEIIALDSLAKLQGRLSSTFPDQLFRMPRPEKMALFQHYWKAIYPQASLDSGLVYLIRKQKGAEVFWQWLTDLWTSKVALDSAQLYWYTEEYIQSTELAKREQAKRTAQAVRQNGIAQIELRYNYKASLGGMEVLVVQDSTRALIAFDLPLRFFGEGAAESAVLPIRAKALDTLVLPLATAPRSLQLSPPDFLPARILEDKPDAYWLYTLSKAESDVEKRAALEALFETDNQRLLPTVVGIALRDSSESLRLMALDYYPKLTEVGKIRLQRQMEELAQSDPSDRVRKSAARMLAER